MMALPIPDRTSSVRYRDIGWRGRDLGGLVETLTLGKVRGDYGAHLDPDLRAELRPRRPGWKPLLGQLAAAQGHLRNQGVGSGDLFLFWGLFRRVDGDLRWVGRPMHVVWGWLQVGAVVPVDGAARQAKSSGWAWTADHPHLAFPPDPSNTLYVAADRLDLGNGAKQLPAAGVFEFFHQSRCLTAEDSERPGRWRLPCSFMPSGRAPLTYHQRPERWTEAGEHTLLESASRGQEFVLDGSAYPDAVRWAGELIWKGSSQS